MRILKVGVIGLGFMGHRYSAIFRELPTAELVAVADVREEGGRKVAADNGAEHLSDGVALIRRPDIEAVAVCTPEDHHVEYCLEAIRSEEHTSELQSRLHVLCRLLLSK